MKTIQSSLYHRVIPPRNSAAEQHPTIIMLHGRGADEEDLPGLADYLDDRMLVISPRAPYPFSFGGGYMWYEFNGVGSPDPTMFRTSHDKLQAFVTDCLAQYPIDPKRLYLLGFSMGTVMSHALALTQPELFRGIVANSGYVAEGTMLTYHWDKLADLDVFIAHGTQDPVIPIQFGRRTRELYASSSARVTYNEYAIGHQISQEELDALARWLSQSLDHTT